MRQGCGLRGRRRGWGRPGQCARERILERKATHSTESTESTGRSQEGESGGGWVSAGATGGGTNGGGIAGRRTGLRELGRGGQRGGWGSWGPSTRRASVEESERMVRSRSVNALLAAQCRAWLDPFAEPVLLLIGKTCGRGKEMSRREIGDMGDVARGGERKSR